jgi:hypothetical protein
MTAVPPSDVLPAGRLLERGTVLGRYVIDGWVRDGGMASLHRGHHVKTGAKVAIKVQRRGGPDDEATAAARFEREGQVMGRLSGVPYVVQVHDVDELPDGRRYLVMEWIEGDDLEETLDDLRNADRRMEIERACRLLGDVARALVAVHAAQVVHRDLKPSNVMIDRSRAERETAKLLDFGISADLGAGGGSGELTAAGVVLGTAGYVAPEQALGLPADPGFDVYAFGAVAFEVLTGRRVPPDGLGPEQLPPVSQLRPSVPAALSELVGACLQRDPTRRPTSAALADGLGAIGRGLERAADEGKVEPAAAGPAAAAGPVAERAVGGRVRLRAGWMAAALLGVAGVAAIAGRHCGSVAGTESEGRAESRDLGGANAAGETAGTGSTSWAAEPLAAESSEGGRETAAGVDEVVRAPAGESAEARPGQVHAATGGAGDGGAVPRDSKRPPSPEPGPSSEQCERLRRQAAAADDARDWSRVLQATADARCWITKDQRNDRKALRVEALAELGRYAQCVKEGAGSTDPRVASRTKVCRVRSQQGSE